MARIRIIAPGVYGQEPSEKNPTGEYPIGFEFTTDAKLPEGWKGKYHVVEHGPAEGSVFVANPASDGEGEPGPLDGNVDELVKHLDGVDNPDEVQKLIDAETAGKSRKGALAALEARRDELLA